MRTKLEETKHLITEQYENEQAYLEEFRNGTYTYEAPYVALNPYVINPLAAVLCFNTEAEVAVTLTVKGKTETADFTHTFPAAKEHILPVYGLYPEYDNQVEIALASGEKAVVTITTEKVNANKAHYVKTTPEYLGHDLMFISTATPLIDSCRSVGIDLNGDIRWVNTEMPSWDIRRLANGRLLYSSNRTLEKPYYTLGLFELDLSGKVYKEYRIPGGYHHDAVELENGNLLVSSDNDFAESVEDYVVELDRKTGDVLKSWDLTKILPRDGGNAGDWIMHDWFHNNSVCYDKATNSITMSGRHKDAIINFDYDSGALNWIVGDSRTWPEEYQKYFFTPVGDGDFDWQYEQHDAVILPNGNLMCFDNGTYRTKGPEGRVPADDNFSRGVIYRLDTDKMEIEQVWQYGKERGAEFFSPYICNCDFYGEGHYMVHSGGIGTYRGHHFDDPGAAAINTYAKELIHVELSSITVEVKDDEVMYEMKVLGGNYYRARRLPVYDEKTHFELGRGEILGSVGTTGEFMKVNFKDAGELDAKHELNMTLEIDRLSFRGTFTEGSEVIIELRGETDHFYNLPTEVHDVTAACISFDDSQDNNFQYHISRTGLSGDFDVYIDIDGKRYDTGKTVSL